MENSAALLWPTLCSCSTSHHLFRDSSPIIPLLCIISFSFSVRRAAAAHKYAVISLMLKKKKATSTYHAISLLIFLVKLLMRCLNSLSKLHLPFSLEPVNSQALPPHHLTQTLHLYLGFVKSNGHFSILMIIFSLKHLSFIHSFLKTLFFHLTSKSPDFPSYTLATLSLFSFISPYHPELNSGAQFLVLFFIIW